MLPFFCWMMCFFLAAAAGVTRETRLDMKA